MSRGQRGTILLEDAEVIGQQAFAGAQYVITLRSPGIAATARPGSFVHLRCDAALPMRRPMSIMRAEPQTGQVEILYKSLGAGTRALAAQAPGTRLSMLGPIGRPFEAQTARRRPLLLGGGVGIPPMVFLAEHLRTAYRPLVLIGSEVPFPFPAGTARQPLDGIPKSVNACMPLMEQWGIASRLASLQGYPGCYSGYITELARRWLDALDERQHHEVQIFACGPTPMLDAVARLALDYQLPCQVSLEEYMACAVGGCAGCTVRVRTAQGEAMKRVCVDGPVFDAASLVFAKNRSGIEHANAD